VFARAANSDQEIINELKKVILLKLDCENGEGIQLAKKFNVSSYPTFILTNSKGQTIYRWLGFTKPLFLEKIGEGLVDLLTIEQKIIRFKQNPDLSTALILAEYKYSRREYSDAVQYYKKAADLDSQNDYRYEIFEAQRFSFRANLSSLEQLIQSAELALNSNYTQEEAKFNILIAMSDNVKSVKKNDRLLNYLKSAHKLIKNKSNISQKMVANINIAYTLYIEKDVEQAVKMKKETMNEGWTDRLRDLNQFSWWCFENQVNLHEAKYLAQKAVSIATNPDDKAMVLDTLAEIVNQDGDPREAAKLMELAIKESPNRENYKKQLERFNKLSN
jgi:tetratricopeptide (TPR) repeat protein